MHSSLVRYRVSAICFPEWQEDKGLKENRGDCLQGEGLDHTATTVRIYYGQCQASQSCEEMRANQDENASAEAGWRRYLWEEELQLFQCCSYPHSPHCVLAAVDSQSWSCAVLFPCCHLTQAPQSTKKLKSRALVPGLTTYMLSFLKQGGSHTLECMLEGHIWWQLVLACQPLKEQRRLSTHISVA